MDFKQMEVAYANYIDATSGKRKSEGSDSILENFRTEMKNNYLEDFRRMLTIALGLSQRFKPMFEGEEEKKESSSKKVKLEMWKNVIEMTNCIIRCLQVSFLFQIYCYINLSN